MGTDLVALSTGPYVGGVAWPLPSTSGAPSPNALPYRFVDHLAGIWTPPKDAVYNLGCREFPLPCQQGNRLWGGVTPGTFS